MRKRPRFRDYFKNLFKLITNSAPAISEGMQYELEDHGVLFLVQFPIIAAMYFLNSCSPFLDRRYPIFSISVVIELGILLLAAYWIFFVYFFAKFKVSPGAVKWLDDMESENIKGKYGEKPEEIMGKYALEKKQERKETIKSRLCFAVLAAVIIAGTVLYCRMGYGEAPGRFLSEHKQQLNSLAGLTAGCDDFFGDYLQGKAEIFEHEGSVPVSEDKKEQILQAMNSLRNSYLYILNIEFTPDCRMHMFVVDRWNEFYDLDRMPDGKGGWEWDYAPFRSVLDKFLIQ